MCDRQWKLESVKNEDEKNGEFCAVNQLIAFEKGNEKKKHTHTLEMVIVDAIFAKWKKKKEM